MLCNQNPDKWRRIAMTEKLLRDVIKEAKEKKQLGIVIWSSWTTWENMGQGNKEVSMLAKQGVTKVQSSLFRQMNLANSFNEVKEVPVWEPLKFLL